MRMFKVGDHFSIIETEVCQTVHSILKRPFDIDFGIMLPADGNGNPVYWYEIHPDRSEEDAIEPTTIGGQATEIFSALNPLFASRDCKETDGAVGQDFFVGHNWIRVE